MYHHHLYNNHHDNNTLSNSTPKRLGHLAPKTMATLMRMSTSNEEEEEQQRERESEREAARREEGSRESRAGASLRCSAPPWLRDTGLASRPLILTGV